MDVVRTDQRCRTFAAALVAAAFVVLSGAAVAGAEQVGATPGARATSCLRATGAPDELALIGPARGGAYPTALLGGGASGLAVTLGALTGCASVDDGGTTMAAAGPVRVKGADAVAAAVRDAGAPFARPVVVGRGQARAVVAAAAPTGDAAVAWLQGRDDPAQGTLDDPFARRRQVRLMLATRRPGGTFGAPRAVSAWSGGDFLPPVALAAAFDAQGTLTIVWTQPRPPRGTLDHGIDELADIDAVAVPAGGAAGPIQRLARDRQDVTRIALDVAASGGALLAFGSSGGLDAFERGVPGGTFASTGPIVGQPDGDDLYLDLGEPAVALADDGGAAMIAWRESGASPTAGAGADLVMARTRTVAGPFAASTVVDGRPRARGTDLQSGGVLSYVSGDVPPTDDETDRLRAATRDGRFVLVWVPTVASARGAVVAALVVPGRAPVVRALGGPCRDATGVAALLGASGDGLAAAFTDAAQDAPYDAGPAGGRLHVLGADELAAPRAVAPAPRVTVKTTNKTLRLRYGQKLRLPVTCDRDCDVRLTVPVALRGGLLDESIYAGTAARAGVPTGVTLDPGSDTLVGKGSRAVRLRVTACSPDGSGVTRTTTTQPAVLVPPRAGPHPRHAVARRRGHAIVVTWTIASPLPRVLFAVVTETRGDVYDPEATAVKVVRGRGRTRFRVVLRPRAPGRVVRVVIAGRTDEAPYARGRATARVRAR